MSATQFKYRFLKTTFFSNTVRDLHSSSYWRVPVGNFRVIPSLVADIHS
jgi:hypothetical protein